jgi:hypothetical protein
MLLWAAREAVRIHDEARAQDAPESGRYRMRRLLGRLSLLPTFFLQRPPVTWHKRRRVCSSLARVSMRHRRERRQDTRRAVSLALRSCSLRRLKTMATTARRSDPAAAIARKHSSCDNSWVPICLWSRDVRRLGKGGRDPPASADFLFLRRSPSSSGRNYSRPRGKQPWSAKPTRYGKTNQLWLAS